MPAEIKERPLITFALFAYNQERFIREAVSGALAQTYSPLEIILSDDDSKDRTYEILRQFALSYSGPHKLVLNRNPRNLGLAAHVNKVMDMSSGILIVTAAGDDISMPERVDTLTHHWLTAGRPSGLYSWIIEVDEDNHPQSDVPRWLLAQNEQLKTTPSREMLDLFLAEKIGTLIGCSAAWSKDNWTYFGHLSEKVANEDTILTFRSHLRGGIAVVDKTLVRYRRHTDNIWNKRKPRVLRMPSEYEDNELTWVRRNQGIAHNLRQMLSDVHKAMDNGLVSRSRGIEIESKLHKLTRGVEIKSNWWKLSFCEKALKVQYAPPKGWLVKLLSMLPLHQYAVARAVLAGMKRRVVRG